ncbi:hypothetical protein DFH11DRAFT_1766096 [Phellopilus nigrolimitatus]|nr:hypothetical protein DFH11DRAFT_1766096 [Phellopilus nigrolimitatus]
MAMTRIEYDRFSSFGTILAHLRFSMESFMLVSGMCFIYGAPFASIAKRTIRIQEGVLVALDKRVDVLNELIGTINLFATLLSEFKDEEERKTEIRSSTRLHPRYISLSPELDNTAEQTETVRGCQNRFFPRPHRNMQLKAPWRPKVGVGADNIQEWTSSPEIRRRRRSDCHRVLRGACRPFQDGHLDISWRSSGTTQNAQVELPPTSLILDT